MTSDSLMPPTPEWMMRTLTSGCWILSSASLSASRLPCTSALTMRLRSRTLPSAMRAKTSSSVSACCLASASVLRRLERFWPSERAVRSSLTTRQNSPATGSSSKPMISTGVDGPPLLSGSPLKSRMARTRPLASPATMASPTWIVPRLTSMVATTPRPGSTFDSMMKPLAGASGLALRSRDLGDEQQHVEEVVEADALLGAGLDEDGVAAPLLGHEAVLGELLLDAVDVGVGLVDLVDHDDDRHAGRLGVVDGLDGLRHDAVVGGHHDGGDVGDLGAAGAHGGEGGVARACR